MSEPRWLRVQRGKVLHAVTWKNTRPRWLSSVCGKRQALVTRWHTAPETTAYPRCSACMKVVSPR